MGTQRIYERRVTALKGDSRAPGNLLVIAEVDLVDTDLPDDDRTSGGCRTVYVNVPILPTDTLAQTEPKRGAAYKQAWIDEGLGAPPANAILQVLKAVAI